MMSLSAQEMLDLWKLRSGYVVARRDCEVERTDGVDLDGMLMSQIGQWYAGLLATAPVDWLPVEDVAARVAVEADAEGVVAATLPGCCVRPVAWRLRGWSRDVTTFHDAGSAEALRQGVRWLRGNACRPVAVAEATGLRLYSIVPGTQPVVERALCVVRPADGVFTFATAALATIPRHGL